MIEYGHFIGGKEVAPRSGQWFTTIDPATEEPLAEVARAGIEDVNNAVAVASPEPRSTKHKGSRYMVVDAQNMTNLTISDTSSACSEGSRLCIRSPKEKPTMKTIVLDAPAFAFIVATRAVLAGGIGLLLSGRVPEERRHAIGGALVAIGAVATIPAAMSVFRGLRRSRRRALADGIEIDERLIGATRFPRKGDDNWS